MSEDVNDLADVQPPGPATPLPGEIWRHFKGGVYRIVTISFHHETSDPWVVYQNVASGTDRHRELSGFMERVAHSGPTRDLIPRFKRTHLADGTPC